MKDVQATGEASSPQNRTSITSKHEIASPFPFLWISFPRIRIQPIEIHTDPDPQHSINAEFCIHSFKDVELKYYTNSGEPYKHSPV